MPKTSWAPCCSVCSMAIGAMFYINGVRGDGANAGFLGMMVWACPGVMRLAG